MTLLGFRSRRAALLCAGLCAGFSLLLAACGGGGDGDGGAAQLRLINLTNDVAALDVFNGIGSTSQIGSGDVAVDTAGAYVGLGAATYDFDIRRAGSSASLLQQTSRALAGGTAYTVLAYGYDGSYKSLLLTDNEPAAAAGTTKLRVIHGASDAGTLDVYLTANGAALADATANVSSLTGGTVTSYVSITQGTYRLRVTAAGDKTDLRLDIPSVTLGDQQVLSLILTPTSGGVLVNGYTLLQTGALTPAKNTSVRARAVASVPSFGVVNVTLGGNAIASGLRSPSVGAYTLVPASDLTLAVTSNGTAVAAPAITAGAGADLTVLVGGAVGAETVNVIADDNRLPTSASVVKLRLINALAGDTAGLTLSANFTPVANAVPTGTSSTPASVAAGTSYLIDVSSPSSATPLFSLSDVPLTGLGVYTVFMLSGQTSPVGTLRKER